eukprot:TRINITY_DN2045_c0_g1_i8.p2 TRINITY_DN2045_c0_g1~~TRINITY_DN2045_c0_g1_i8.p2  ORF type:complete len:336 (-),score=91.86 TRINITY_DN2045_c0_g1_i8:1189-2196(-)
MKKLMKMGFTGNSNKYILEEIEKIDGPKLNTSTEKSDLTSSDYIKKHLNVIKQAPNSFTEKTKEIKLKVTTMMSHMMIHKVLEFYYEVPSKNAKQCANDLVKGLGVVGYEDCKEYENRYSSLAASNLNKYFPGHFRHQDGFFNVNRLNSFKNCTQKEAYCNTDITCYTFPPPYTHNKEIISSFFEFGFEKITKLYQNAAYVNILSQISLYSFPAFACCEYLVESDQTPLKNKKSNSTSQSNTKPNSKNSSSQSSQSNIKSNSKNSTSQSNTKSNSESNQKSGSKNSEISILTDQMGSISIGNDNNYENKKNNNSNNNNDNNNNNKDTKKGKISKN